MSRIVYTAVTAIQLVLREHINQGRLFGPTLYTAGDIMEGPPATQWLMPVFKTREEADYEAIEAGTRNVAEALGKLDEFGTVTEGKRTDLILVEENPLEDMATVSRRAGVMLRGLWLPEAQLQEMLDEPANSYTPTFIERIWPISLIAVAIFPILRHLLEAKGSTLP